jgi:hypothetical protein
MKHAVLAVVALLFWPIQGTTHAWVWTTIILAAIRNDRARERAQEGARCSIWT